MDYTAPHWSEQVRELTDGKGVDIVVETVGGDITNQALDAMAPFGRMVFIGQSSGDSAVIDPWRLTAPSHSVVGFYVAAFTAQPDLTAATLTELIGYVLSGRVRLEPGVVMPLSEAAKAHQLIESRQTTGKVVLEPWAQ